MKHQALFSLKDKGKNLKVSPAAILLGSLGLKISGSRLYSSFCVSVNLSLTRPYRQYD